MTETERVRNTPGLAGVTMVTAGLVILTTDMCGVDDGGERHQHKPRMSKNIKELQSLKLELGISCSGEYGVTN